MVTTSFYSILSLLCLYGRGSQILFYMSYTPSLCRRLLRTERLILTSRHSVETELSLCETQRNLFRRRQFFKKGTFPMFNRTDYLFLRTEP